MSNSIIKRIKVTKLQHDVANLKFNIETPSTEEIALFKSSMLKLSGWVLYNNMPVELVVKHEHGEDTYKCNRIRRDVSKALNLDCEVQCGFIIPITFSSSFDVGFIAGEVVVWVARVEVNPASKVKFGKFGHLFLDNDSNDCVAQFTGRKLISDDVLLSWEEYFSNIKKYALENQIEYLFTLAPAKEIILQQFYPHTKADITPVEQFLIRFHNENILYPKDALIYAGDSTYSREDTHWTDFGGGVVANYIVNNIGMSLNKPFPFNFSLINKMGDLGVKIPNPKAQEIMKADFSSVEKLKLFDNKIPNRGWIQVYQNPSFIIEKNVVVFGDSFSENLVPYFANTFSRVVFVLSGADIDYDILQYEQPDLVICELTTRFLVRAPESNYSVSLDCKRKILSMPVSKRADFISLLHDSDHKCSYYVTKTIGYFNELNTQ